jgi:predicted DNA binding CopG/RHH family protein
MTKKLPEFKNHEEDVEFWATADVFEYTEPADIKVELDPALKKNMRPIIIRFRDNQINDLKTIAQKKDLPYQTMVRSWIAEKIREELGKETPTKTITAYKKV